MFDPLYSPNVGLGGFRCRECARVTRTERGIKAHLWSVHHVKIQAEFNFDESAQPIRGDCTGGTTAGTKASQEGSANESAGTFAGEHPGGNSPNSEEVPPSGNAGRPGSDKRKGILGALGRMFD